VTNLNKEAGAVIKDLTVTKKEIDWQEPDLVYDILRAPNSAFLESVSGSERIARYSLIALHPLITFESKNGHQGLIFNNEVIRKSGDPLKELFKILDGLMTIELEETMCGAVGYIGYDSARHIEKIPQIAEDDLALPDVLFFIPKITVVFDHHRKVATVYSIASNNDRNLAERELRNVEDLLLAGTQLKEGLITGDKEDVKKKTRDFRSNFTKEAFEDIVKKAKEYIFAGDVYQVNLSQRLTTDVTIDPYLIYQKLRDLNPSPFSAYFDFGNWQMVSCSPERLVKLSGDEIETRPIAGTIRRGSASEDDKHLNKTLISDVKERAEHIMLVDLERNDLGRVSDYGSVKVDELMIIESYSHVTHIVSNVIGKLSTSRSRSDLVRACFPGGTITGCPKIRAMEVIEELEPVRRGPYTGSMGYLSFNGDMDLNIIIRTLIIKDGKAHVQAGAGIVADSIPEKEYYETLSKAEALIKATMEAEEKIGR